MYDALTYGVFIIVVADGRFGSHLCGILSVCDVMSSLLGYRARVCRGAHMKGGEEFSFSMLEPCGSIENSGKYYKYSEGESCCQMHLISKLSGPQQCVMCKEFEEYLKSTRNAVWLGHDVLLLL